MEETANLKLPLLIQSQANKELVHNEALIIIDALMNNGIKAKGINTPPDDETVENGDLFIIGSSPTDAFENQQNKLAFYFNGWHFIAPKAGLTLWINSESKINTYNGTNWVESGGSGGGGGGLPNDFELTDPQQNEVIKFNGQKWINSNILQNINKVGIGTTADDNNKLSVASPYVLLNNVGNSCQLKINKNSEDDSSSLLFQSNWTGHAEFGIVGENNFSLKTSLDGSNWNESFKVDSSTGDVDFKKKLTINGNELMPKPRNYAGLGQVITYEMQTYPFTLPAGVWLVSILCIRSSDGNFRADGTYHGVYWGGHVFTTAWTGVGALGFAIRIE